MNKIFFGLIASVFVSLPSFAQEGTIVSTNLSHPKSSVEIPSELKSGSIWTEENARQFVTLSVYSKEAKAFVSITLNTDDSKLASVVIPESFIDSGNLATAYRNPPCRNPRCILEDWLGWVEGFF